MAYRNKVVKIKANLPSIFTTGGCCPVAFEIMICGENRSSESARE